MRDLISALQERVRTAPSSCFCHFHAKGRETTFTVAQAWDRSARFAQLYRARGLGRGDMVAIMLKHAPDLYFAFLGALMARCVPTFLPFPSPKQDAPRYWSQHRTLFSRIGVKAVVTYLENAPDMRTHCSEVQIILPEQALEMDPDAAPAPVNLEDIAFLQHSSGTTGLKKGVLLSHGAVSEQIGRYAAELRLGAADVIVSWLPLYHDMGLIACFVLPVMTGATIVSLDAFEWVARPKLLLEAIERYRGTHVWLPNFAFHHLCRTVEIAPSLDLSSLRAVIDCSEPCRPESLEQFVSAFGPCGIRHDHCRVCYAMAETVFAVTQTPDGSQAATLTIDEKALGAGRVEPVERAGSGRRVLSVGRPLADVEIKIVDVGGDPLADRCVGEVILRAPFLFSGYHNDPARTALRLQDGWYSTGDVGFLHAGELYLLGRSDDLLIINGRNLMAHDVEFVINAEVEQIKSGRCVALGVYNEGVGSQDLIILAEPSGATSIAQVARQIRSAVFEGFAILPKEVKIVPPGWLTKTTSGKIAREANLMRYMDMKRSLERAGAQ